MRRCRARHPSRYRLLPAPADVPARRCARGRRIGFQGRKLHEDDPLRGKYVNSPESELFHKSNASTGFNLARGAIAKQDRAIVVEGNTDVIALRQVEARARRGVDGHSAHRAAALVSLATRRPACSSVFDADAAGEDATLRGNGARAPPGVRRSCRRTARRARTPPTSRRTFEAATCGRGVVRGPSSAARARARPRPPACVPAGTGRAQRPTRVARAPRSLAPRERPARPDRSTARRRRRDRECR